MYKTLNTPTYMISVTSIYKNRIHLYLFVSSDIYCRKFLSVIILNYSLTNAESQKYIKHLSSFQVLIVW